MKLEIVCKFYEFLECQEHFKEHSRVFHGVLGGFMVFQEYSKSGFGGFYGRYRGTILIPLKYS